MSTIMLASRISAILTLAGLIFLVVGLRSKKRQFEYMIVSTILVGASWIILATFSVSYISEMLR